jgi:hypothetical protein
MVEVLIEEMFGSDLKPTERLQASRGRRCSSQRRTRKTTLRSERSSALKKGLTEPTLLEMFGWQTGSNHYYIISTLDLNNTLRDAAEVSILRF